MRSALQQRFTQNGIALLYHLGRILFSHEKPCGGFFFFIFSQTIQIVRNALQNFQIILQILPASEGIFRQKDRELQMHARGWRQRFFKIFALRSDQFIFQPGSQKRQGIGILFIQLFRINFPENGEQIFHDSRACLPFRPGIDRKRGRRRAFQPGGWIGQRIVQAQTVSGQRRREKIFRRLPEAPGVAVQKKVKKYGGKAEKKDGGKQTGEFLFQSNVLMHFLSVYEGSRTGMTGTGKSGLPGNGSGCFILIHQPVHPLQNFFHTGMRRLTEQHADADLIKRARSA